MKVTMMISFCVNDRDTALSDDEPQEFQKSHGYFENSNVYR